MLFFQREISRTPNITCFMLLLSFLLLGVPHGGCQASSQLQTQIQAQTSIAETVAGTRKLQHDIGLQHAAKPLINHNDPSAIAGGDKYRYEEKEHSTYFQIGNSWRFSAVSPFDSAMPSPRWWQRQEQLQTQEQQQEQLEVATLRPRDRRPPSPRGGLEMLLVDFVDDDLSGLVALSAATVDAKTREDSNSGVAIFRPFQEALRNLESPTAASTPGPIPNCTGAISEVEYQALQDLYLSTGGANWIWHNTSSSSESHWIFPSNLTAPCSNSWEGINCAKYRGPIEPSHNCSVIGLALPLTNLRGQLPAAIGNLSRLEILNLENNYLEGTIPSSLGNLTALTQLYLDTNSLTGPIPSSLGDLSSLTILDLYVNSLTGPIPSSLGNLSSLTILYLTINSLTGPIPSTLSGLTALTELLLNYNSLTGRIPSSLGNLTLLTLLYLNANLLVGPIPTSLANLGALTQLYAFGNFLTGPIPSSLGNLTALTILAFWQNLLTGPIPSSLGNLTALTQLYFWGNSLTGPIPSSLGNLAPLAILDIGDNPLTGTIPSSLSNLTALTILYVYACSLMGPVPSWLGKLTALTQLTLHDNLLTGPIPSSLGDLTALTQLYLEDNLLTGPIPSSLGDLRELTILYLQYNSLTGLIPSTLGNLVALNLLYLSATSITGPIPSSLGSLTSLSALFLDVNLLTGPIPPSLGYLTSLLQLGVSVNSLTGTIPFSLGFLTKCLYINISTNLLTGFIPVELGNVGSNLSFSGSLAGAGVVLDLSQNALSGTVSPLLFTQQLQTIILHTNCMQGSLPSEICLSSNLETLVLDKLTSGSSCQSSLLGFNGTFAPITLQGSIPECVWTMSQLQTLHLSGNGLHGTLGDIGSISSLINVDLSNNFFSGSVPISLQTQPSLQQLDLANNKLSGFLSPSFAVSNLELLMLAVNRLSGDIPESFASTPNIQNFSVLTGNLFSCGSPLPAADSASSSYVCGSKNLDIGLFFCGCALLVFVFLGFFTFLFGKFGCVSVDKLTGTVIDHSKQDSESILESGNLHHLINVVVTLKGWLCALGLFYVVMALPAYAILKSATSAGILAEQYTWITTSAYLHGYASAAIIGLFVGCSGVILGVVMQRLDQLFKRTSTDSSGSRLLPAAGSKHLEWKYVLQRILIQTISLAVVLVVNVFYVYGVVSGGLSESDQVLTEIAIGLFKVLWQHQFVTQVMSWMIKNHDDISEGGLIFHQVAMSVVSFIVAPCLATLGTDSNCLYDALVGAQSISSSFSVTIFTTECIFTAGVNGTITTCVNDPYQHGAMISITPPWFYSYQCTSALLTNYIPALLFTYVTSAVVIPLLQLVLISVPEEFGTRSSLLKYLRKQSLPSCRKPVADVLLDLLVLMTFGLASPLLGLMIIVKQIISDLITRISFGRYVRQAEDPAAALASLEYTAQQLQGGDTRALLGFLLSVVGIFWGAMIFDMVADLYGNTDGAIIFAMAFAVWTTVASLAYWAKLGDRLAASLSLLFRRGAGDYNDKSGQSADVAKRSLAFPSSHNPLVIPVTSADATCETCADIQSLNSVFVTRHDSDSEII